MQLTDEQRAAHFLEKLTKGSVKEKLAALTVLGLETRSATLQTTAVLAGLIRFVEKQNMLLTSLTEKFLEVARAYTGEGLNDPAGTVQELERIQTAARAEAEELKRLFNLTGPAPKKGNSDGK